MSTFQESVSKCNGYFGDLLDGFDEEYYQLRSGQNEKFSKENHVEFDDIFADDEYNQSKVVQKEENRNAIQIEKMQQKRPNDQLVGQVLTGKTHNNVNGFESKEEKEPLTRRNGIVEQDGIALSLLRNELAKSVPTDNQKTEGSSLENTGKASYPIKIADKEFRMRRNAVDDFTSEFTKERTTMRVLVKKLAVESDTDMAIDK